MTYPRHRNGWADNGDLIRAHNRRNHCPNCGSDRYGETVSMESCDACGLRFDYWGRGGNQVFDAYLAREHARQREAELERERKQYKEWEEEQNWHHRVRDDSYD